MAHLYSALKYLEIDVPFAIQRMWKGDNEMLIIPRCWQGDDLIGVTETIICCHLKLEYQWEKYQSATNARKKKRKEKRGSQTNKHLIVNSSKTVHMLRTS